MSAHVSHTSHKTSGHTRVIPRPRRPVLNEDSSAEEILSALGRLEDGDPQAVRLRERVTVLYQPLVNKVARRYGGRGEPLDDLKQTAMVGLVKAIHG